MTYSSFAAAAIPAAPSSTLSPHAAPFTLRSRPVCDPPGRQQDGDSSRLIDDNLMLPAVYFGMESCDAAYPGSAHGMPSQPSSSSRIHVNAYPTSSSSTSGYTWMASELRQDQFLLTSGKGKSGNKSTKVTIKCPPNRTLETNNIGGGSKSKLAIKENDDCTNEAGKAISFGRNSEFKNLVNESGSSQGTMELNPVLKPLYIPSTRAISHVLVADDGNPDPSECSVDSPCWQGALSSRVSSLDVRQASDDRAVKQELADFNAGKSSTVQDCEASTEIKKLVASKSKQNHSQPHVKLNHSQPHVKLGLIEKPEVIDTNLKSDSHGKELGRAEHGSKKCNAEHTYCLEVRNNCTKQSGLNSAAPDFIPLSVQKSSSGNGLGSSIISHGSCSSTGRNTSEILKEIKSKSDVLQKNHSDDIELEEHDLSLLQSIIENLQSYLHKATKGPVKVASDKAGLKACHPQNAVLKSVAVKQNGIYTAENRKGIIISNMADCTNSSCDFGRNSLTGYQPAPNNFWKESSYEDENSQVLILKNLWIDAERANCALKYQLKQTRMAIDIESNMAHNGGPRNPSIQLCDMVKDPSSSVGLALTCPPMLKDHPGERKTPNLIYVGDDIHSGDNIVLSRSSDYDLKNIQGEHLMPDLEESSIHRLQLVPNKSHRGVNTHISNAVPSHSYITRRDDILPASCEFGLLDWEHVPKDEIA